MKKLFFVTYIAAALFISNTVRADIAFQTPAKIDKVTIDPSTQVMTIFGTLSNPCSKAITSMAQDEQNPNVLLVTIAALSPQGVCIAMIQDYEEIISLPELVQRSPVQILPSEQYLIKVLNNEFEYQTAGSDLLNIKYPMDASTASNTY